MSFRKILTLVCAGVLGISSALAIPSKRIPRTMTQPDGSTVTLTQIGDEFFHCFITTDGYLVQKASDGTYCFIDNSGVITEAPASDPESRSAKVAEMLKTMNPATTFDAMRQNVLNKSAFYSNSQIGRKPAMTKAISESKWDNADKHDIREFPTDGEQNVLVILVNFSDKKFSFADDPLQEMTDMMNEVGYSGYDATGSAYDFYTASSNGIFKPSFDVYGPVEMKNKYSYYGANGSDGTIDLKAGEMVKEAVEQLDDQIDYTTYDRNNDGYVDNVYVFYAGYGEADSYYDDTIWPHSYYLEYALGAPITLDGVKINKYATSNELNYDDTHDGIGTFCHEFGHVLGLPDIYSTNYNGLAFSPGAYCTMDYGSYNNNGRTPPLFSTYEQYALEWLKPTEITEAATINMLPLTKNNIAYKISADQSNPAEYFLFENRQTESWDKYIPGHGMLVWHIDFNQMAWDYNTVNNNEEHQYVDLVEADNQQTDASRSGDPFPGTSYIYEFTHTSKPAFKNWANKAVALPITNISESPDGVISFKVNGGGDQSSPLYIETPSIENASVASTSVNVSWNKIENADGYRMTVYPFNNLEGEVISEFVDDYIVKDLGDTSTIEIENLLPGTTYSIRLYAYNDVNLSSPCIFHISTAAENFEDVVPTLSIQKIEDVTAEATWTEIADADSYKLTVATREEGASTSLETVNFNNNKMPSGWTTYGIWDSNTKYCGEGAPSIKLLFQGDLIESPLYDEEIESLSFWCRSSRSDGVMELQIFGRDGDMVYPITTITDVAGDATGSIIEVKDIPGGIHQIAMYYFYSTSALEFNIDDIKVNLRGEYTDTPIAGYNQLSVEGTSAEITGLQKSTDYVAYVQAVKGDVTSKKSYVVKFRTAEVGAVESVESAGAGFIVANGIVIPADNEVAYSIYSIDGRTIAYNVKGAYRLPDKGIYIVKSTEKTAKICW